MLKSEYITDGPMLSNLIINWPYSQQEIYSALEQEDFSGPTDYDGKRSFCFNPQSPILKDILDKGKESSAYLLNEICELDDFSIDLWHLENKQQIIKNVTTWIAFLCDKPGFTTSKHIDSRLTVCTGMFFFNKEDDADQSTYFYTEFNSDTPTRTSSQFGHGWYAANTHGSWHVGSNNSHRNRYSLYIIQQLNLK
jgi:hypothetical protein